MFSYYWAIAKTESIGRQEEKPSSCLPMLSVYCSMVVGGQLRGPGLIFYSPTHLDPFCGDITPQVVRHASHV